MLLAVAGVAVLVAAAGGWTALRAWRAHQALTTARGEVATLRAELHRGDVSQVPVLVAAIRHDTSRAKADTDGWLLRAEGHLPLLGTDVTVTRTLAGTVDEIAEHDLPDLAQAVTVMTPARLRRPDGTLDIAALQQAQPVVARALTAVQTATGRVSAAGSPHLTAVRHARGQLIGQLAGLRGDLTGAQHALDVLVPLLGPAGPRTYFVAFQNPAEAHGTGGLIGNYAVLRVDHGKAGLLTVGTDADLDPGKTTVPVDLPAAFWQTWGGNNPTYDWRDSNIDPNFPDVGKILVAKYLSQFHTRLDGAIALDPSVLQAILGPTGALHLPNGRTVTGAGLPQYMLNTLYAEYGSTSGPENTARKKLLDAIVQLTFDHLQHAPLDSALLNRLEAVASTGHVQIWSAHPAEQAAILTTEVSGAVPTTPGPFAFLSTLNDSRNKADYFLDRTLTYTTSACPPAGTTDRSSTITVTLTNHVPLDQPHVVKDRFDTRPPPGVAPGQSRERVSVIAAQGAQLVKATTDGQPVDPDIGLQSGHPIYTTDVELPRNTPVTLVLTLAEPAGGAFHRWRPAPLVRPEKVTTNVPVCR